MQFFFEIIFEIIFELIIELVLHGYMKLMTLILPEHQFSPKLEEKVRKGVTVYAVLLFLFVIFGFIFFIQEVESVLKAVGGYMLFISLGIIGVQIIAGIIYRIIKAIKRRH